MTRKSVSRLALGFPLFFVVIFLGWTLALQAFGQTENPPTERYTWTKPTYGTRPVHYVVQMLVNSVDTVDLGTVTVPEFTQVIQRGPVEDDIYFHYGNKYQLRVAGVDSAGNQGPFSAWSDPYSPELDPPGF